MAEDEAEAPKSDELDQIETSSIEKLVEIKAGQERLRGLIEKAEAGKDKVSAEVFQRVTKDYDKRVADLEKEAHPLRDQARTEFEKLRSLHGRLSSELDKARLDLEELKFRHELGELPDKQFGEQEKTASQAVSTSETAFAAADALRQRFLEVIPEPPPPPVEKSSPKGPAKSAAKAAPDSPPADAQDLEATVYEMPSAAAGKEDTARTEDGKTRAAARLVEKRDDGADAASYVLTGTMSVGRTKDNDIFLDFSEVSRHHARIVASDDGLVVTDLKSGNGTYVNDARITESPLVDGDTLRFGSLAFVVHTEPASG